MSHFINDKDALSFLREAPWIYENENPQEDEYTFYSGSFIAEEEDLTLLICADNDAAFYLNGELVYFGVSPSYPNHPIADAIAVKGRKGENHFSISQYYFGSDGFSSYCKGPARLKFVILDSSKHILSCSGSSIQSCLDLHYQSHLKKVITPQLGYSYSYDANEFEYILHPSFVVPDSGEIEMRINQKCRFDGRAEYTLEKLGEGHYMIDFGKEVVGVLDLDFVSEHPQKIRFTYAEHRESESLTYLIGGRDFSIDYTAKAGQNVFCGVFRRLGLRYLEVFAEEDLNINYIGIQKVVYPFEKIPHKVDDPLLQKIYDVSVYTLECCYHEHYEDCPWREQCLYAMDSFNQALAGSVCFTNTEQIKSSLKLISYDQRSDHLLSICSPSNGNLTIPGFSLFYIRAVDLYLRKTGDVEFVRSVYPKIREIAERFFAQESDGLLYTFDHDGVWNFYEWAESLDGGLFQKQERKADLILNGLFLFCLPCLERIEKELGLQSDYSSFRDRNIKKVRETLLSDGFFAMSKDNSLLSEYGNALAILVGYANEQEAKKIAEELKKPKSKLVKSTLASRPFVYDALLKIDANNASFVISDIKRVYGKMLGEGATTFYETELGWRDFSDAGSLCHGWSACAIHYLDRLGYCH